MQNKEQYSDEQLEQKLTLAQDAFLAWRQTTFAERADKMLKAAALIKGRARSLAEAASREMGKPIKQAVGEVNKCAWVCEYYAQEAEKILASEQVQTDAGESFVRFDPLGPILAVMPWNFPYWQVFRFAAPALMAGNVGLLKHASNVPECALNIEKIFVDAGFPVGVFQTLLIGSSRVERVLRDSRVVAATLTGSELAGRSVAAICGDEIKKTVLELGGSDPFVVLADADLDLVMQSAVMARLQNNGQSCIAAKRYILEAPIADVLVTRLKEAFEKLNVGDPLSEETDVGPLVDEKSVVEIERQVNESVARGAKIVTGGKRLDLPGAFYAPTILANVVPGMPAYDEEIFGPVLSVMVARDGEDAIRLANDTRFGLGASLWTRDVERAKAFAARIEAGCVFVNGMVKSDPRLPFGGIKKSGYGRELSSWGIREFVNVKTVWIR